MAKVGYQHKGIRYKGGTIANDIANNIKKFFNKTFYYKNKQYNKKSEKEKMWLQILESRNNNNIKTRSLLFLDSDKAAELLLKIVYK